MPNIEERLRVLRTEKNLTQRQVASGTNMSLNGYRQVELGESKPSLETVVTLADFYSVSIDFLIGRSNHRDIESPAN